MLGDDAMRQETVNVVLLICAVFLTGCCSIVHDRTQIVQFYSQPAGAQVKLDGFDVCKTPCRQDLRRDTPYLVSMELNNQKWIAAIQHKLSGCFWGNIFFGGLIGWAIDGCRGTTTNLVPDRLAHSFVEGMHSLSSVDAVKIDWENLDYNGLTNLIPEAQEIIVPYIPKDLSSIAKANKRIRACNPEETENKISIIPKFNAADAKGKNEKSLLDKMCRHRLLEQ